jgi:nitrile hydratase
MDGIHDLGGLQGFGAIVREALEPVFHAPWEGRMFAITGAVPFAVPWSDDHFRPAIERMEPVRYLQSSYYEKWYGAIVFLLTERGFRRENEPITADAVRSAIQAGASQARPGAEVVARFKAGDRVLTRAFLPSGHNRLPRYARAKIGVIEKAHGAFLVADRHARGDQGAETLYTVVFRASSLWGPQAPEGDTLSLDLWDSYLEPAQ